MNVFIINNYKFIVEMCSIYFNEDNYLDIGHDIILRLSGKTFQSDMHFKNYLMKTIFNTKNTSKKYPDKILKNYKKQEFKDCYNKDDITQD